MKLVKNKIRITQDVVDGKLSLANYVSSQYPLYDFLGTFSREINSGDLLGIFRRIDGLTLEVNFIVDDSKISTFKTWLDSTIIPALPTLVIMPESEVITHYSDAEIRIMFSNENNHSSVSFSGL